MKFRSRLGYDHIDNLEEFAKRIALDAMQNRGSVPPTVLVQSLDRVVKYAHKGLVDVEAKDRLAQIARLLAVANAASTVTMVLESWAWTAKELGGPLTDKIEVVTVMTETHQGTHALFLGIERSPNGKFKCFGEVPIPAPDSVAGRFANILPPILPTLRDVRIAEQVLSLLGVSIDGDQQWPCLN